jgi:GTP pyrophosphokinase
MLAMPTPWPHLKTIGGSQAMQAASYLVYACDHLNKPHEVIAKAFGSNFADLAMETTKLVRVQRMARLAQVSASHAAVRRFRWRRPLLRKPRACARCCWPSRATCAWSCCAWPLACRPCATLPPPRPVPPGLASEALQVFAPLANRLGIWEIKWEMEDLSFRFLEPDTYRQVAKLLDEKRVEREAHVERLRKNCRPRSGKPGH